MKKADLIDNQLITQFGSVLNENVLSSNISENKYYAVVAMCGHVGVGYFIPILFGIYARNKDTAKEIIKNTPRVKNEVPNFILEMEEISRSESYFIKYINNRDNYLYTSLKKNNVEPRKIILPNYADMLIDMSKGIKLSNKEKIRLKYLDIKSVSEIKLADEYFDYQVLQKNFAPRLVGERIVYPKKVDMNNLLKDYFDNETQFYGLKKQDPIVLAFYFKIFGPKNKFGISVKDDKISFVNLQGEIESLELDNYSRLVLDEESDCRLLKALESKSKTQSLDTDSAEGKSKTGLERFNDRMEKTFQMQGKERKL